jgi:hypothetical protein
MSRGEIGEAARAELIRLRVAGRRTSEIAEALGVSRQAVGQTLSNPDVRAEIEATNREALDAVRDSFVSAQLLAWRTMVGLLRDEDVKVRLAAAKDILDRGPMVRGASVSLDASVSVSAQLEGLTVAQLRALVGEEDVVVLDVPPGEAK